MKGRVTLFRLEITVTCLCIWWNLLTSSHSALFNITFWSFFYKFSSFYPKVKFQVIQVFNQYVVLTCFVCYKIPFSFRNNFIYLRPLPKTRDCFQFPFVVLFKKCFLYNYKIAGTLTEISRLISKHHNCYSF